jgi:hypothetical protein
VKSTADEEGSSRPVLGAALYFVVRLAVLHAMKAHTRWVDQGKRTSGPAVPPYPPAHGPHA